MTSYEDKEGIYDAALYLLECDRLSIDFNERDEETLNYLLSSEDTLDFKSRLENKRSKKMQEVEDMLSRFENGGNLKSLADEVIALSMVSPNNRPGKFVYLSTLILETKRDYEGKDILNRITNDLDISKISKYSNNLSMLEKDYREFIGDYLNEDLRERFLKDN